MEVKNKVALITGSTQGIGKAIADVLLQAGAQVIINSRNSEKVLQVINKFEQYSNQIFGITADISNSQEVSNMVNQIEKKWGTIDILINNAGIAKFAPILEITENNWDEMLKTNLKGVFLCTKEVLPEMIKRNSGHIFTITSVAAKKVFQNCAAYAASKAGALAFMNVLREEIRQYGIHVTSIIAGATNTPLWDSLSGDFQKDKMMTSDSIAQAVLTAIQNSSGMVEEIQIRPVGGDL